MNRRFAMDLNRLRYFLVVAETGSIRRAAELLHLTPTALSKSVKVLEGEIGAQLIAPLGRGITLTDQGRLLARRAAPMLAELATLPDELSTRNRSGDARPIRYGSHEVFGTYFSTVLLEVAPDAYLEHRYRVPGEIERALLDHEIDIGISYIPMPTAGTTAREIVRAPMAIFGRPEMVDRAFDDLRFAAPATPTVGSPVRAQGLDGWPDDRVPRHVRFRITHTESALELCRQGHAVAYFPRYVVRLHNAVTAEANQLVQVPSPPGLEAHEQPIYLITRTGDRPHGLATVEAALHQAAGQPT